MSGKNELSDVEVKIIKELTLSPRQSDNQISQKTGIPLKTVNRKRKNLEENNIIRYMLHLNHTKSGTQIFGAKRHCIITFKEGLTRANLKENLKKGFPKHIRRHVEHAYLGEDQSNYQLHLLLTSRVDDDILEIYHSELIPFLDYVLGKGCIKETATFKVTTQFLFHHNYMPHENMENGSIKPKYSSDEIMVG